MRAGRRRTPSRRTPVVGGGSFNTAPKLKTGRYADTVAAGETVYWKVDMRKGQVLRVRATVDTSEIETDFSANDYLPGLDNLDYDLDLWSPLREPLSDEYDWRGASVELEGDDSAGAKTGEAVTPRALGYEQILATDFNRRQVPGARRVVHLAQRRRLASPPRPRSRPSCRSSSRSRVEGTAQAVLGRLRGQAARADAGAGRDRRVPPEALLAGDADAGRPALTIGARRHPLPARRPRPRRARHAPAGAP